MYGVPEDLDLTAFLDSSLTQVRLGMFEVQFCFSPEGNISVEGRWEVQDGAGSIVDHQQANEQRESCRLHLLLGQRVVETRVNAPNWFSLRFENGLTLTVWDSSEEYESFSIQPGEIYV